jgi:hypothetical protein
MPLGAARFGLLGGVADLGKLELIETQTASTSSSLDFTDLGSYNVHFLTLNNFQADTSTAAGGLIRLSNNGGSSFISTSNYQRAWFRINTAGTTGEIRSTNSTSFDSFFAVDNDYKASGGYAYFYNLLDSSKYSFVTFHSWNSRDDWANFGSFVLPVSETHNALRIFPEVNNFLTGTASLYGIAES